MKRAVLKLLGRQKGFTLVELLVVVAILGVLAAIVIPNVASFMGTGTSAARQEELRTMQTAVTAYMAENETNSLPGAIAKTNDFSGTVLAPYLLLSLSTTTTEFYYSITAAGAITQTDS